VKINYIFGYEFSKSQKREVKKCKILNVTAKKAGWDEGNEEQTLGLKREGNQLKFLTMTFAFCSAC
jgi:hypothetical protein